MTLPPFLRRLLTEPPPEFVFEVSEAGIAVGRPASGGPGSFVPLPPGTVSANPLRENVLQPEVLAAEVARLAPVRDPRSRRRAVLILPDYCARVAVLEFDTFPAKPEEQAPLVRFRMKKSVPFDVDSAAIGYHARTGPAGKTEVVAAVVALEIVARYEAPFRAAGYHPGFVTTSALAALDLVPADAGAAPRLLVKGSGRTLTVVVLQGLESKLVRCVELPALTGEEILGVLHPTLAFVEDELRTTPRQALLCGFGGADAEVAAALEADLGLHGQPLTSRYGAPGEFNAGLLGYLQGMEARA